MLTVIASALRLKSDERGVTALEYGLIAAVLATVVIVGFNTFGGDLSTAFTNLAGYTTIAPAAN